MINKIPTSILLYTIGWLCLCWACIDMSNGEKIPPQVLSIDENIALLTSHTTQHTTDSLKLYLKYINVLAQKIPPPNNMVLVKGGITQIGNNKGMPHEQPAFEALVFPFYMDISPITVAQFREFTNATGYITEAETFGNAAIVDFNRDEWILKKGANWQYPLGKEAAAAPDNHPVTHVSWNDAQKYCNWAGKRLPKEIEWEHAARNAQNDKTLYPWGNNIVVNELYQANIWQGTFPTHHEVKDGFEYASPVGHYGKSPLGLTDMTGNVWEWCDDWMQPYTNLWQKTTSDKKERVQRGGSFLCEPSWCHGYRVSGRSSSTPETAAMHVGFRCVKDINFE